MRLKQMAVLVAAGLVANASAELIVYKGTEHDTFIGAGSQSQISSKAFIIVDHDSAECRLILYRTAYGQKMYTGGIIRDMTFVQVDAANGRVRTLLTYNQNDCDRNEGHTSVGIFIEGANAALKVNTNSTIFFPKSVTAEGRDYSLTRSELRRATLTGSFDQANTLAANGNGETLDGCWDRLIGTLESQGYSSAMNKTSSVEDTGGLKKESTDSGTTAYGKSVWPIR